MFTVKRILASVVVMLVVALIGYKASIDGPEQEPEVPENPVKGGRLLCRDRAKL